MTHPTALLERRKSKRTSPAFPQEQAELYADVDNMLRDMAYVLQLTRTLKKALTGPATVSAST
jgi:hypothetical protein